MICRQFPTWSWFFHRHEPRRPEALTVSRREDAPLHPAGDGDELACDVAGEALGGEHDDLRGDVLGLRDLAERHRARVRRTSSGSSSPRVIGETVQPGATALTRTRDPSLEASFFSERSRPTWMAAFAAA